jgi:hypothetical protein
MAGIVSATKAQCQTARDAVAKLLPILQQFSQSSREPTKLNAGQITTTDAAVDAVIAALAPLNT